MTYFFRVLEHDDGTWSCRSGRREIDRHDQRDDALDHITAIASKRRPSQVLVQHLDGHLRRAATFDRTGQPQGAKP
jgi:uncharacterized protein DUF2188